RWNCEINFSKQNFRNKILMNNKSFIIRAQKLIAKSFQTQANLCCSIRRFDDGVLSFDITHFDKRYGPDGNPHSNRRIIAYNSLSDVDRKLNKIQCFIDKLLSGEDALIEEN
ncbi:MAG: hypothetical protein RR382_05435, partial [Tannerellaceae bacterium]